jgi:hypothetical protein
MLAVWALTVGGCCTLHRPPVPSGPTRDQKGPELHTYFFTFGPDGSDPCAIKSAGVGSTRLDGKPDPSIKARTCPGDVNCARASKKNGDKVRFVSTPPGHKFLVVFDPFKPSTFQDGEDFSIDPAAMGLPTGKTYSFSIVATKEHCTPLDPKIIIDL